MLAACQKVVKEKGAGAPLKHDEKGASAIQQTAMKNLSLLQKMLHTAHQHTN